MFVSLFNTLEQYSQQTTFTISYYEHRISRINLEAQDKNMIKKPTKQELVITFIILKNLINRIRKIKIFFV